jgi:hypothetical protein
MQFYCKTQKYEPLHNSQDEVSRQEDVPLQKDASYTNSIQKNFHIAKNSTSATQNKPIPSSTNKSLHPQAKEIDAGSKFCAYKILTIAESSVFLEIRHLHNYLYEKIFGLRKKFPKSKTDSPFTALFLMQTNHFQKNSPEISSA